MPKAQIAAAIAAGVLVGCAGKPLETSPVSLTDQHRQTVEAGIRSQLKDPSSAQFGSMSGARSVETGAIRVCGTVNAKNSYGGYGGQTRFVADIDDNRGSGPIQFKDGAVGTPGDPFAVNVLCSAAKL